MGVQISTTVESSTLGGLIDRAAVQVAALLGWEFARARALVAQADLRTGPTEEIRVQGSSNAFVQMWEMAVYIELGSADVNSFA